MTYAEYEPMDPAPPDPDPEHQAEDLSERLIGHAHVDIMRAIEQGAFAVETPRVHVGKDHFERINWGIKRDTKRRAVGRGDFDQQYGDVVSTAPYLTATLEWSPDEMLLLEDMLEHSRFEGPCIIYGEMHLWRMDEQLGRVQSWIQRDGTDPSARATIEWRSVEPIGWR